MKILFLDQAMNWWFVDWYPRCNLPDGIVGARFIFLRTNKLLKNRRVCFCSCSNGSSASFTRLCQPSLLDFFYWVMIVIGQHSKLGCSFQILDAFQPFSLKSFLMTAFCLFVKTILLRSSESGNFETYIGNISNLFYYYWNLFYYLFFWGKHICKMFFSLMISLAFPSFIRSLIYNGS